MHKVLKFSVILFCFLATAVQAQNKYALVVGINDYYDAPGVKSHHLLQGCVNDANSMKDLLKTKFGFAEANIHTLYNEKATVKNLMEEFRTLLKLCQPGDAFVFYYSGHGVWMRNPHNLGDDVKKGKSQAMVMSDLYAPNWGCLFNDESVKYVINSFVDKKVIVTSIFDCCFSADLPMMMRFDQDWILYERARTKDMDLVDIPLIDSTGFVADLTGDEKVDAAIEKNHLGVDRFNASLDSGLNEKAFDISKTMTVALKSVQLRPMDRKNSRFLSLAATDPYSKGLEIKDPSGNKRGAFTLALTKVYEKNSASISLAEFEKQLKAIMKTQMYSQNPTFHYDSSRLNSSLIGLPVKQTPVLPVTVKPRPMVKVYIPAETFTAASYQRYFNKYIMPQVKDSNYTDQTKMWDGFYGTYKFFKVNGRAEIRSGGTAQFTVLLPFPSFLATGLRSYLAADPNIEVVSDSAKADVVLVMNYASGDRNKAGYVISFSKPDFINAAPGLPLFNERYYEVFPSLPTTAPGSQIFYNRINRLLWGMIRKQTTAWLIMERLRQ